MSFFDDLLDAIEEHLTYSRETWIQVYWWLALGQSDEQAVRTPDVSRKAMVWPPFWGERVPLGGDAA